MNWYFGGSLRALRETGRGIISKPITEGLRGPDQHEERYRASFALVDDEHGEPACIACGQCAKICPSQVIEVGKPERCESEKTGKKRGYLTSYSIDLGACCFCELCVQVCPTDALAMVRQQEEPGYSREDLVLTRQRLEANASERPRGWAVGSTLRDMQDPSGEEA